VAYDIEAGHRVKRGCSFSFAIAEVESRVVPWTPDRSIHHESIRQRTAIVRADGARCKYLLALANQDYGLAIEVAQQRLVFCKVVEFYARPEIESGQRLRVVFSHFFVP
jgi:hypothetical protein